MGRLSLVIAGIAGLMLLGPAAPAPWGGGAAPVRAAYFYHYMGAAHLDSLAARGFDRALIHWIADSLGARGAAELAAYRARGRALGIEIVPEWALQMASRLAARPADRRYTWGGGTVEPEVACPLDSVYWRGALLDRAEEFLAVAPESSRIAVDLELYRAGRHHYDAGPCRCPTCLARYRAGSPARPGPDPRRLAGLLGWEEARLEGVFAALLEEFAARHRGVELGVFDLDYDSFVHRALARALARARVAAADYCERSYDRAGAGLPAARARLDALGLADAALIGGLWLKRFAPSALPAAARSVMERAQGYFAFTTFSLWIEPSRLEGPYTLLGTQAEYWAALEEANRP